MDELSYVRIRCLLAKTYRRVSTEPWSYSGFSSNDWSVATLSKDGETYAINIYVVCEELTRVKLIPIQDTIAKNIW